MSDRHFTEIFLAVIVGFAMGVVTMSYRAPPFTVPPPIYVSATSSCAPPPAAPPTNITLDEDPFPQKSREEILATKKTAK